MSLGPQCWRCRKRRLRCDSSLPSCRKCLAADVHCPGYGDKKPVAWRDPLVLTNKGVVRIRDPKETRTSSPSAPASVLGIVCRSPRTAGSEMHLRIAADAIEYFAPDLVPYATTRSPFQVSPRQVGELAVYLRNAYISIAALHRHVSGEPSVLFRLAANDNRVGSRFVARSHARSEAAASGDSDLLGLIRMGDFKCVHFASQAAAFRALGEELHRYQPGGLTDDFGPSIFLGIIVMLSSQIQFSAYAPWQSHVDGAWSLVQAHGGLEVAARMDVELCRLLQQFALLDIFGMTTHRLTKVTAKTIISRSASYASMFHDSGFDSCNPWRLIPNQLAKVLIRINVLRAQNVLFAKARLRTDGLSAILDHLDGLSPTQWAAAEISTNTAALLAPSDLSEDHETKDAWVALMTAYRNAAILYAISSLTSLGGTSASGIIDLQDSASCCAAEREMTAYHALLASLHVLFDQRTRRRRDHGTIESSKSVATSAGLLHKFVIWPMVIAGIHSALVHHDQDATGFLCSGMQTVGEELGTVSMIDGARLIKRLGLERERGGYVSSWDDLFDGAPLFFM
ncbi:Putative zn(2)Cys(6) fungal-type DNA-binding domain, fungal transcription factor [Colletotrichum destructivum]|uniref:Zn(2)Cys(6) fungal-type DNA-binding domain, fungal transcription factor n=1 Tax=Colletotrichum destructivum TaxID=34406 RepID=A0AAX4I5N7_9PEZI|nr:Putative zn(2)Cys(6) fungal-type DNA-binding domain, fungal transcription factor [Colletotrichum destructivum]